MNTKLTLNIERYLISKAKNYARQQGRSLSDIIENYLTLITTGRKHRKINDTPIAKSLRGSIKLPRRFAYKEQLKRALREKYHR